jgi:hypothetical protein
VSVEREAMSKNREGRPALCPYCCLRPGTTKDHVIPQSLFPKPLPNGINLPTIKACAECNNVNKSGGDTFLRDFLIDTFLRDFLITDMHCSDHPAAQSLLNGEMGRAMRSNRSDFARAAVPNGRPVSIFTSTGLYVGECYTAPLDGERINRIFATITRGLYFKVLRRFLPTDTQFEVRRQDPRYIGDLLKLVQPPDAWCRPPKLESLLTIGSWLLRPVTWWVTTKQDGLRTKLEDEIRETNSRIEELCEGIHRLSLNARETLRADLASDADALKLAVTVDADGKPIRLQRIPTSSSPLPDKQS